MIEVCCGSAKLAAAFRARGVPALGIDHKWNKHAPIAPALHMDLSTGAGMDELLTLIKEAPDLQFVWLGVPCGSASRARQIPAGDGAPRPLRSEREPWGRTDVSLSSQEQKKLSAANKVYTSCLEVIKCCDARKVGWAVENPGDSLLWYVPEFGQLLSRAKQRAEDATFHACEFGGSRK